MPRNFRSAEGAGPCESLAAGPILYSFRPKLNAAQPVRPNAHSALEETTKSLNVATKVRGIPSGPVPYDHGAPVQCTVGQAGCEILAGCPRRVPDSP